MVAAHPRPRSREKQRRATVRYFSRWTTRTILYASVRCRKLCWHQCPFLTASNGSYETTHLQVRTHLPIYMLLLYLCVDTIPRSIIQYRQKTSYHFENTKIAKRKHTTRKTSGGLLYLPISPAASAAGLSFPSPMSSSSSLDAAEKISSFAANESCARSSDMRF